jgi:hypothetical protein
MTATTQTYLADYRVCRPGISAKYLTIYANTSGTGWLDMEQYTASDIYADLRERGVSNYDISIIDNHYMVMNDGVVVLSANNTDIGSRQKLNCLRRVAEVLSR